MPIPKLFLKHAAGGQQYLAERLWVTPHAKLWGRTPESVWDDHSVTPFKRISYRERVLAAFSGEHVTHEPVDFTVVPQPLKRGNGKPALEDPPVYHRFPGWEALFSH